MEQVNGVQVRRRWTLWWVSRAATAAAITAGLVAATIRPAAAAPAAPAPKGPDGGATPTPQGALQFPTVPQPIPAAPADAIGPLGLEIIAATSNAERLGEQLKAIDDELTAARAISTELRTTWETSSAKMTTLQAKAAQIATDAYKHATAMGPFGGYANDLQNLGLLIPALPAQNEEAQRPSQRDSIGYEVAEAEKDERAAHANYDASTAAEQEIAGRRAIVEEQFNRHRAALETLRTRNAALLGGLQSARNTYEDSLSASRGLGTSVNGLKAAPAAVAAVSFALSQQGKMYEWAAEGPNTYDCSGLMLASYRSVGLKLPRVARDQYGAGTPVLASQLLPGDLLFFSTDRSDWRQIHHVAMYIGGGRMVHAPTWGEPVQTAPIWWTEYFGATRVVPAVAAPGATPPPATPPAATTPPATTPPATTPPATTPPAPPPTTTPPPSATTPPPTTVSPGPSLTAPVKTRPPTSPSPTAMATPSAAASPTATATPSAAASPSTASSANAKAGPAPSSVANTATVPAAIMSSSSRGIRRFRRARREVR
jgi:cell wall-associated NlpC family hydrolase